MEFKFGGLIITCENVLSKLEERINSSTEYTKPLEQYDTKNEHINKKKTILMYRERLSESHRIKFQNEHKCFDCLDFLAESCKGVAPCKYEDNFQREEEDKHKAEICPMDKTGSCPYGRPEGICIGLPSCYREVIEGIRGGKGRNESNKEEKKDG